MTDDRRQDGALLSSDASGNGQSAALRQVNPSTGGPEGTASRRERATNTVFVDGSRPSHVILPVVERAI
jgi:hypothetical protein